LVFLAKLIYIWKPPFVLLLLVFMFLMSKFNNI